MTDVPLELEQVGEVTIIRLTAHRLLDQSEVDAVKDSLLRLAGDPGRLQMLLDFAAVEAFSSGVLAILLTLRRLLLATGGRLALCGLRPGLREVFGIAGLEGPLNLYDSEQEALQSFGA
jgi:anti-sigma B factor antagonist